MDSADLIEKEKEFKKLNKQLEKKTDSLMKQIEKAMQKPDFFSEIPQNISLHEQSNYKKHCCETPKSSPSPKSTPTKIKTKSPAKITVKPEPETNYKDHGCDHHACDFRTPEKRRDFDNEFLHAFVIMNIQEKVLPSSFTKGGTTVESVCKFLASKAKLLQEQVDTLQATIDKKASQCEKHLARQADLESERMTFLNNINNLNADLSSAKAKCASLQNRFNEKERICEKQRSELDSQACRMKQLVSKIASEESKQSSYERTVDKLRKELESAKIVEKEFRSASRELSASHRNAISGLESRIKTLTSRIHKQAELIENLKRQNALLITDTAIKALEKEYCKFLDKDF
ncbi:paramyosin-like [Cydia pomonella]|uniref:paramyosin-like n=1 Tax=Cydia pomonella TaxID=82600 RepID=UPI002ADD6E3E|nr:paramyosin-like [Cydia pomonella]